MTERLHLAPKHRAVIEALLREHLSSVEVWAYGSRVNGRSHDGSDLDLVLRGPGLQEIPVGQVADFEEAVRESSVPFLVEARDWARLPERFHREIERGYVVLMEENWGTADGESVDWSERMLGELTDNFDSVRVPVKQAERRPGPYPYYGASGIVDHIDDYLFDGEYLLVAEDGENLRTRNTPVAFLATGKFWVNNHAHIVRGNRLANTRYLMYTLSNLDISGYLTGSTMPKLTQGNMNRIHVLTPPLPEQRAIAHVLGTLDDKIELNRRMNETLEAMARALFKSWFVDFDPVRAKAALRHHATHHTPGSITPPQGGRSDWSVDRARTYLDALDTEIAALFPDCFVDSELGEIPAGWEVKALPELIEVNPKRSLRQGELAPYLDMVNMPTKGHVPDTIIDRPFNSGMRFANGDTLVARITPCLENGKTAYVDFLRDGEIGWGSTEYIVMRPKRPLPTEFAYCLARSNRFRDFAIQNMTGTSGRQRVPAKALSQFMLPAPPGQGAASFGKAVQPLLARASKAVQESRVLATLRDMLLQKLVSGELRLRDTRLVKEAGE